MKHFRFITSMLVGGAFILIGITNYHGQATTFNKAVPGEETTDSTERIAQDWKAITKGRPTLWDYRPPQLDRRYKEQLATARTARVSVEQVYAKVNQYDVLGEMELPFANVVQQVLEHAGIRVLQEQDATPVDFTLRVLVIGWTHRSHKIDNNTWAYMEADIQGTLSIEIPRHPPYIEKFESGMFASPMVSEYAARQRTRPSEAPFLEAFQQFDYPGHTKIDKLPNSGFIPRLLTIVSFVYGPDPLIQALAGDDEVLQRHAMKALEQITGQHFGRDIEKWKEWSKKHGDSLRIDRQQTNIGDSTLDPVNYQDNINDALGKMSKAITEQDIQALASVFVTGQAREIIANPAQILQFLERLQSLTYTASDFKLIGPLCYVTVSELFVLKNHDESQGTKYTGDIETYVFCLQADKEWKLLDHFYGKDPFLLCRLWQNSRNMLRKYEQCNSWDMHELDSALHDYSTLADQVQHAVMKSPESAFLAAQWTDRVHLPQLKLSALADVSYRRITSAAKKEKEKLLELAVKSRISATEALCFMARPALKLVKASQTKYHTRVDIELHPVVRFTILNQLREYSKDFTPLQKKALAENLQYARPGDFTLRDCLGNDIAASDLGSKEFYDTSEGLQIETNKKSRMVEEIVSSSVNSPLSISIRFPCGEGDCYPFMVSSGRFRLLLIRPTDN